MSLPLNSTPLWKTSPVLDGTDDTPVTSGATVTAQIYELGTDTVVGAPITLAHQGAGVYEGEFPLATLNLLTRGKKYEVETLVVKGGSQQARRRICEADFYGLIPVMG